MKYLISILVAMALYLILLDVWKLPTRKVKKRISALLKEKDGGLFRKLILNMSRDLRRYIHMNAYNRSVLEQKLRAVGKSEMPEEYLSEIVSESILKSALLLFLCIPLFCVSIVMGWIWIGVCAVVGFYIYFKEIQYLNKTLLKKRKAIERELPRFASSIKESLKHNPNILDILVRYKDNTCPELSYELEITVADMSSGSYETAITNLETRVASPMMSEVTRGLIGALRGDAAEEYWERLAQRFDEEQKQELRREALKIPAKVRNMTYPIMAVFIIIWISLLIYMVMNYSQSLF